MSFNYLTNLGQINMWKETTTHPMLLDGKPNKADIILDIAKRLVHVDHVGVHNAIKRAEALLVEVEKRHGKISRKP